MGAQTPSYGSSHNLVFLTPFGDGVKECICRKRLLICLRSGRSTVYCQPTCR
uniref:Uncharacterized protein n=1 Tax=Anguilla anguilla TaxID=7936 RepID=A0A0E9U067_ANGAN